MVLCIESGCYKKITNGGRRCPACQSRRWRASNAVKAAYLTKKANAKRDGIPFEITFKEFKEWCAKNDYIKFKGQLPDSYTIDRVKTIDESGKVMGYTIPNIQILSLSANSVKSMEDRRDQWKYKKAGPKGPDCPF